jgi:hypothetical protein
MDYGLSTMDHGPFPFSSALRAFPLVGRVRAEGRVDRCA